MEIIISDTTTPIILAKTNHLDLLSNFVKTVYIPLAVKEELSQKSDGVQEAIEKVDVIKVVEVQDHAILEEVKLSNLDKGETEAIALALEKNLDLIIDERLGRRYAQSKNINIIGLLGILKINLFNGFISYIELLYMLEEFKEVDFRISPRLEKSFLNSLF